MDARRILLASILAAGFAATVPAVATAQSYPSKPIKMVVPFPPGGPIDVMGRLVADRLTSALGQNVVIENRPGAGATIGSRAVATADPDGYTLLFGSSGSLAVTPALYKNAGYDPVKSFAPIAGVSSGALLLAVHPDLAARNVKGLVDYAKANPGKLNYGSGLGTPPHIAWGLFTLQTGTKVVYVSYKGAAPAITDLLAGRMHFIIDAPGVLIPHIQAGNLRALAVTSKERIKDLPDVPTMAESGYPEFLMTFWTGVVAPASTPAAVVERINKAINDALQTPQVQANLARFRVLPMPGTPQQFGNFIASEAKKWAGVIAAAGIKIEQ
jgi:tripartite-type tricarboxylate transporter receptor subunit TctC